MKLKRIPKVDELKDAPNSKRHVRSEVLPYDDTPRTAAAIMLRSNTR